jgi:hypothetical protein
VEPETTTPFTLSARSSQSWDVRITAPDNSAPGNYPVEWRFYDNRGLSSRLDEQFAVHFRWLTIGPFSPGVSSPLAGHSGPDTQVALGQSYRGQEGRVRWQQINPSALSTDGWVKLGHGPPGAIWYGLSAVSTSTHDAQVKLESPTDALLRVNGYEIGRTYTLRRSIQSAIRLTPGSNYLLVKVQADDNGIARIRLDLKDVTGDPLFAADYRLERLVEGYAYLGSAPAPNQATPEGKTRVEMRLIPITYRNRGASSVSVVGSFNGWSPRANVLSRGDDGVWRTEIRLRPGSFEYKLVVDGTRWIADPANPSRVSDGFGALNSVLIVR